MAMRQDDDESLLFQQEKSLSQRKILQGSGATWHVVVIPTEYATYL